MPNKKLGRGKGEWINVQAGRKNKDLVPARTVAIGGALGPSARSWCKFCGQRHVLFQHGLKSIEKALKKES